MSDKSYYHEYALPPEKNLWGTFDRVVGAIRNFFAAVGVLTFIGFVGYWSTK